MNKRITRSLLLLIFVLSFTSLSAFAEKEISREKGESELFKAIKKHHPEAISELANLPYLSIESQKRNGWFTAKRTPLMLAAELGDRKSIEILQKYGASSVERDASGKVALHYALKKEKEVKGNFFEIIKLLSADTVGDGTLRRKIIETETFESRTTPLYLATNNLHYSPENERILHYFLENGAKVNKQDRGSRLTPIEVAIKKDRPKFFEILFEKCDDPKYFARYFSYAIENKKYEYAYKILQKGGIVNLEDENIKNSLCKLSNLKVINKTLLFLIELIQDKEGNMPTSDRTTSKQLANIVCNKDKEETLLSRLINHWKPFEKDSAKTVSEFITSQFEYFNPNAIEAMSLLKRKNKKNKEFYTYFPRENSDNNCQKVDVANDSQLKGLEGISDKIKD